MFLFLKYSLCDGYFFSNSNNFVVDIDVLLVTGNVSFMTSNLII
jgi:hypothetical protein